MQFCQVFHFCDTFSVSRRNLLFTLLTLSAADMRQMRGPIVFHFSRRTSF